MHLVWLKVLHLSRGFLHSRNSHQVYVPSNRFATWTCILLLCPSIVIDSSCSTTSFECSRYQLFCFNSMRLSMVWYATVALFSDWSKSPRKKQVFLPGKAEDHANDNISLRQRSLKLEKGFRSSKSIVVGIIAIRVWSSMNPLQKNPSFEAGWLWNRSEMMSWRSVESSAPMRSWSEGMYPRRRDMFSRHVNASPLMFTVRPKEWMLLSSCFASLHVSLLHLNHLCPHWFRPEKQVKSCAGIGCSLWFMCEEWDHPQLQKLFAMSLGLSNVHWILQMHQLDATIDLLSQTIAPPLCDDKDSNTQTASTIKPAKSGLAAWTPEDNWVSWHPVLQPQIEISALGWS